MSPNTNPANRSHPRQWLVYELSDRWIRVVRRFAADFMDEGDHLSVIAKDAITSDLSRQIRLSPIDASTRRVILWQVDRENLHYAASAITQSCVRHPNDLQIAAVGTLSTASQMALSELGIAAIIRYPEQLPGLRHMIRRHFAGRL